MRRALWIAAAALALALYLVRSIAWHPSGELPAARRPSSADPTADSVAEALFLDTAERLNKERADAGRVAPNKEGAEQGAIVPATGTSDFVDGERWQAFVRSDIDLAILMFTGAYGADVFVRHTLLNPSDRPLRGDEYADFHGLVERLLAGSRGFRTRLRDMAAQDRLAMVRDNPGAVPDVPPTPGSAERAAKKVVEMFKGRGEDITLEQARDKISSGEVFSARLPPDSTFIQGKVYRNVSFGPLPRVDSCFEQLRYVAMEEMAAIVAWFVVHEYATYTRQVTDLFRRMESMSARDVERQPR